METTLKLLKPALSQRLFKGDLAPIFYISVAKLVFHFVINATGGYGIFRDELYYLACADHLAAGYVDQPPLSVFMLKFSTLVFGDSLFAIRVIPALCGAATIFITGLITLRLGGKWFAQILAGLCSFTLISIGMNSHFSMNSIDIFIWTAVGYIVLRIIQTEDKRLWPILGLVLGLGLLNKIGVLFLGCGLFIGLVITPQRKWLTTTWPYAAGIIALIIFSPYIIWNMQHDWAHLEFIKRASEGKYSGLSPLKFIGDQFLMNNLLASVVWIAGLLTLLFHAQLSQYRWLAFLFLGPLAIFILNGTSKGEYLAPGYAILWAAGSVWWENLTASKMGTLIVRPLLIILIFSLTVVAAPLAAPILPVDKYIAYAKALGEEPSSSESKELSELPQHFADMFGWEEKARDVAIVFNKLSAEEKKRCAIFGTNYGDCGAIDYYGKAYGLPKAIGNHNNYWIWGTREYTGDLIIIMGGSLEDHIENFESVTQEIVSDCQYCMPYEDNMKIFLGRKLKVNIKHVWPNEKHYD
ncbi:glycosyltransferase family 39 protein [Pseudochryseolinea flava]|uniref:Glycosyltransferase RgtA/B/C/D-like domain-containing protein n=1 Tax=Pseudochryseolinea flava TaxID=2059302 RepID=A0A364Y050_9BACT|nr:glycosyltransferase family 39 protein [Pseudochryseolinea flava]RAV99439.1 hypothetical protein DQQ10_19665 [Pseudochryseolinea flava]